MLRHQDDLIRSVPGGAGVRAVVVAAPSHEGAALGVGHDLARSELPAAR